MVADPCIIDREFNCLSINGWLFNSSLFACILVILFFLVSAIRAYSHYAEEAWLRKLDRAEAISLIDTKERLEITKLIHLLVIGG